MDLTGAFENGQAIRTNSATACLYAFGKFLAACKVCLSIEPLWGPNPPKILKMSKRGVEARGKVDKSVSCTLA
jgi:hypothetical protein